MLIYLESLGCARNQVDSENMRARLSLAGLRVTDDPARADAIVINTCSFIESAADESIDAILTLARQKASGRCRRLIVTGCLPERYRDDIMEALPEVDLFLGTGAYDQIVSAVQGGIKAGTCLLPDPDQIDTLSPQPRQPMSAHTAYLKIAEGCSRHCTYCIIPKLRGRLKSRPLPVIVQEARTLIAAGVKELTLVAQETTAYGHDGNASVDLAHLLDALADLNPDVWIRLMYGHPATITERMLETMASHANICPYIDIPVQHAAPSVLRRMGRHYTDTDLFDLFATIRRRLPDVSLRTTVLVGFPGESDADFDRLKRFVSEVRFDHLGVFAYSDAEDLPSHGLADHVAGELARERLDALMMLQQDISAQNLTRYLGRQLNVLLEECQQDGAWSGRTMAQGPEVDGVTFVRPAARSSLTAGEIVRARIVESMDYDLVAEAL